MAGLGLGLAGLSMAQKATRIGIVVLAVLLLVGFIWWRIDAYGDSRYDAGVADTDAKWQQASQKLKDEAAKSATRADDRAAKRLDEFVEQAEDDRKAVEDANANGTSPLDALFGG